MTARLSEFNMYEIILIGFIVIVVVIILFFIFYDKGAFNSFASLPVETFESHDSSSFAADVLENSRFPAGTNINTVLKLSESKKLFVLVYDDGCPHCVQFKPTWIRLLEKFSAHPNVSLYSLGGVEQDRPLRSSLEAKFNVQGYPTVLRIVNGKAEEYTGTRDFTAVNYFIEPS